MVMEHEVQLAGSSANCSSISDSGLARSVVEIGLARVDRDDRDWPLAEHRFRLPNISSEWT
jgi:hypothetical protein